MTETIIEPQVENTPNVFTQAQIGWTPWLQPLTADELTERHYEALVDRHARPHRILRCWCAIRIFWKHAPRPTRTSSTMWQTACRAPNGNWPPRRHRAPTAAFSALRSIPGLPPTIPNTRRKCRNSSMKASPRSWRTLECDCCGNRCADRDATSLYRRSCGASAQSGSFR